MTDFVTLMIFVAGFCAGYAVRHLISMRRHMIGRRSR
jgi:hypothetical protein